jgi:small subunit ribosomal protein S7
MSRKGGISKREIHGDPVHNSVLVTQLINNILLHGKRGTAEAIVYGALKKIEEKTGNEPIASLKKALDNIKPQVEVKSRRVGGATYQVPVEVQNRRATTLALRWLTQNTRKRREKSSADRLAGELMDAMNNTGSSVKKKEDLHKMAEANRAFAHYRW